jgi:hypothetical protein
MQNHRLRKHLVRKHLVRKHLAPKYLAPLAAAAVVCFVATAAQAAPVTAADLAGKRICWNTGSASNYGAGGHYSSDFSGQGTWAIAPGGVHIHTASYDYRAIMQKLPDGSFTAAIVGTDIKSTGKYCN